VSNETKQCSFCGLREGERSINRAIRKVVIGPKVQICDVCVGLCQDVIAEAAPVEPPRTTAHEPAFDEPLNEEPPLEFSTPPPPPPPPPLDPAKATIIERLEKVIAELRGSRGLTSLSYDIAEIARDAGYKEPKPGLEPEELAAVVRVGRAAPTDDVAAYVEGLQKDLAAWRKAARSTDLSWASLLGVGMLGIGTYLAGQFAGKGGAK